MNKEFFKNEMNSLSDEELITILKNRQNYQEGAIDAVMDVSESRGLQFLKLKNEIKQERLQEEINQNNLIKEKEQSILKFVPKIVGVYQIAGGLFLFLTSMFLSDFRIDAWAQIFLVILTFLSIIGGYLFLTEKKNGALLCLINQVLQIIRFQFFGFTLKYCAGLSVGLIIESSLANGLNFGLDIQPGGSFVLGQVYAMNEFFGFNIIPIIIIYYIYQYKEISTNK
ncbi:hypothetical protein [uncultured Aquimarina sp.]|uniref:hypothetical protein n=1 Tax=uncultured Aquimarina sp. TaxID=575652 RepID=UPI00260F7FAE|nr:hypothetical protein [uncultured Aquimarina sp.]